MGSNNQLASQESTIFLTELVMHILTILLLLASKIITFFGFLSLRYLIDMNFCTKLKGWRWQTSLKIKTYFNFLIRLLFLNFSSNKGLDILLSKSLIKTLRVLWKVDFPNGKLAHHFSKNYTIVIFLKTRSQMLNIKMVFFRVFEN